MKKEVDCQVFEDQLDAFSRGTLSEEGMRQLRLHARSCPNCAMQLRLHEHLVFPALEELEAEVPDNLVASMWPRVRAEIARQDSRRDRESHARRVSVWSVSAAAAALLLLVGGGYLLAEVRQLRAREDILVQQIAQQEKWLAELDLRTASGTLARTASLAGSHSWQRLLARKQSVTVSELSLALAKVPPETTVLDAPAAQRLLRRVPLLRASARGVVLTEIRAEDGLQAREATRLFEALGLAPGRSISTARLLELTAGPARAGRS